MYVGMYASMEIISHMITLACQNVGVKQHEPPFNETPPSAKSVMFKTSLILGRLKSPTVALRNVKLHHDEENKVHTTSAGCSRLKVSL